MAFLTIFLGCVLQCGINNPNNLANNGLLDLVDDNKCIIWTATLGSGLNRLDPYTRIFTHYQNEPVTFIPYPDKNDLLNVDPRPVDLYKAYKLYKKGDVAKTINVMEELGFKLDRTFKRRIEPNGQADSLIFTINESAIAIFHTVDLIYLKNVDVTITIKTDQNIKLLFEFRELLEKEGLKIKPTQCSKGLCHRFEENDEFWIVDKRWRKWTYTKWRFLYRHFISAHGGFLMVSLTETIPEEWVPRDKVPRDKVY